MIGPGFSRSLRVLASFPGPLILLLIVLETNKGWDGPLALIYDRADFIALDHDLSSY